MGRLATCLRAHAMKLPTLLLLLAATSRVDTWKDSKLPKWAVVLVLAGEQHHVPATRSKQFACCAQEFLQVVLNNIFCQSHAKAKVLQ